MQELLCTILTQLPAAQRLQKQPEIQDLIIGCVEKFENMCLSLCLSGEGPGGAICIRDTAIDSGVRWAPDLSGAIHQTQTERQTVQRPPCTPQKRA